ncbi:DUF4149 domain-containing protein [Streptomyces sp. NPDC086010]|uniref:DUF4149 domain-containing protein n=1 Tax=Streptomyces sp. NPDC086010 TaxID=3365745 RepID=UPI0037D70D7E
MTTSLAAACLCSVWIGAVVSISFLEAPLKFRAPGLTMPLALSVGRVVFPALIRVETVLLVLAAGASATHGTAALALLPAAAVLAVQALVIRPRLDVRALQIIAGRTLPQSRLHLLYVAGETIKLVALTAAVIFFGGLS